MDDFEKAIRVVFAQGDPTITLELREQATRYCDAIKSRPDGWRVCWDQFTQRGGLEVKFWCLQVVIQGIPQLPAERLELRAKVLDWLQDIARLQAEDSVIRNKVALVYVGLLRLDFPVAWPSGWQDLLSMLGNGPDVVDLFLRVLIIFDEEVVNDEAPRGPEERQRAEEIKSAMHEADVARLVECWYTILVNFRQSSPQLVVDCLKVVGLYAAWVDPSALANERFFDAICGLIAEGGRPAYQACDCLGEILSRKMEPAHKVSQFEQFQLLRRLDGCTRRNLGDIQMVEKEAELVDTAAEVILEAYDDLRLQQGVGCRDCARAAWELLTSLIPFIFHYFSHQEYQIADSVEEFLTAFFQKVKTFLPIPDTRSNNGLCHTVDMDSIRPIMTQTLQLLIQRLAYPEWFEHCEDGCEDDERHIGFLELRRSMTKIFKRIFLLDEHMVFQFLQASTQQLTQSLSAVRPMEVEAVLFLLKEAGDLAKDLAQHLQSRGPLAGCFVQVLECEALLRAEQWAIQIALIELFVRYGRIFTIHTEVFQTYGQRVVESFVGCQGIRAKESRVVARACYMFSRFIKATKWQVAPFASQIYDALKDLLVVPYISSSLVPTATGGSVATVVVEGTLRADEQAGLYEAIASLVATMPPEQMRPALQMLLTCPAGNLAELIGSQAGRFATDAMGCASWAARSIEMIATISKPFTAKQAACTVPDWQEALALVGRSLECFSGHGKVAREAGLWREALLLCRRMIEVLGDNFLTPLDSLLPLLLGTMDQSELIDILAFAQFVVAQYQKKIEPMLHQWFRVLFTRPYDVFCQMADDSEQLKREKIELCCGMLQFLRETSQRCPSLLLQVLIGHPDGAATTAPRNGSEAFRESLATFLLLALSDAHEAKALFLAAATWSSMLDAAISMGPPVVHETVAALPVQRLLTQLMYTVVRLDLNDAQSTKALGESAAILKSISGVRLLAQSPGQQQQVLEHLQQALASALLGGSDCSALGIPVPVGPRQLCDALAQEACLKDVRAALQQCASEWRRISGATVGAVSS